MNRCLLIVCCLLWDATAQTGDAAAEAAKAAQLLAAGQAPDAVVIYERLLRSFPTNPVLLLNISVAEYTAGRYRDALDHLDTARRIAPDLAGVDLFLGASHLKLGDPSSAVEPLKKPSPHSPYRPECKAHAGRVFARRAAF